MDKLSSDGDVAGTLDRLWKQMRWRQVLHIIADLKHMRMLWDKDVYKDKGEKLNEMIEELESWL